MLTGTYLPGDSPLHRARPGAKVAVLALVTVVLFFLSGPVTVALVGAGVVVAYAVAGVPAGVAAAQVWPMRWFVGGLFAFQVWSAGWATAAVVCANLVVAVAAASLVTLTTRVDDLRAAAVRGLRALRLPGVDPDRVGLLVALVIRSIPVIAALSEETRQARRARGMDRSLRAYVTPIVIRTVRHAERVGDALIARGVDDGPDDDPQDDLTDGLDGGVADGVAE